MFGFVTVSEKLLTEEQLSEYKKYYCGLCRTLGERYGEIYRLALTYDMSFLVLFLDSLYEPETVEGSSLCYTHLCSSRTWCTSAITEYAADMTVLLAYYKALDDVRDENTLRSKLELKLFKNKYSELCEKYPEKCELTANLINEISEGEASGELMPDELSDKFGRILEAIFDYDSGDYFSAYIKSFGFNLGKFIYIMDAAADLEEDVKKGRYNPFADRHGRPDNAAFFRSVLQTVMSDTVRACDMLPLVKNKEIINNILCSGIWRTFNSKFGIQEETPNG